jgi:hypothetical protein
MYVFIPVPKNFKVCVFFFISAGFKMPNREHNTTQWEGPKYQHYSTHYARINSYFTWPTSSKQKAKDLSEAGFFYTGKKQFINKKPLYCKKIHFI